MIRFWVGSEALVKETNVMIAMVTTKLAALMNLKTLSRVLLSLFALIVLVSCGNSKFILGPLYNRLDDEMRKEFNKLGDFDASQKSQFEERLQTFHLWHRRMELPRYAALLDKVATAITDTRPKTLDEIKGWTTESEDFSVAVRACHPVNYSFDLMRTLTDDQVNFIERRFAREQKKNRARYDSRTPEERQDRRYNFVIKWSGRIGLDFTQQQKALLREKLEEQISLREQYWGLSKLWNTEFFIIAREQNSPEYRQKMEEHLGELWTLLERNKNEEWQFNRDLWAGFLVEFANTMNNNQRRWAEIWLPKLARTLRDMSNDSVKFEANGERLIDPSIGCTA